MLEPPDAFVMISLLIGLICIPTLIRRNLNAATSVLLHSAVKLIERKKAELSELDWQFASSHNAERCWWKRVNIHSLPNKAH